MVIYAPLIFLWIYYSIRARAIWYFSTVNPQLEFSGFEGEGKREMYDIIPSVYCPKTIYIQPGVAPELLLSKVKKAGIQFPLVVKPDRGMQGILFRIIENEMQLISYHNIVPVEYIVQEYIDLPVEVSVFHIRYPGQEKGKLTGFILKEYLSVTGDGISDLLTLIQQDARAGLRENEMKLKHHDKLSLIPKAGEKYYLSFAGNHNQGAKFINLHNEIDERLCNVFDKISNECKSFYYGRYDLKCASIEDLKNGRNFYILEFNGTGAEPNHIYDCNMPYRQALKVIAGHWKHMFEIGKINYASGVPYWSFIKGTSHLIQTKKFWKMLRRCDIEKMVALPS